MMLVTLFRNDGYCRVCNERLRHGERVHWVLGYGARHLTCEDDLAQRIEQRNARAAARRASAPERATQLTAERASVNALMRRMYEAAIVAVGEYRARNPLNETTERTGEVYITIAPRSRLAAMLHAEGRDARVQRPSYHPTDGVAATSGRSIRQWHWRGVCANTEGTWRLHRNIGVGAGLLADGLVCWPETFRTLEVARVAAAGALSVLLETLPRSRRRNVGLFDGTGDGYTINGTTHDVVWLTPTNEASDE